MKEYSTKKKRKQGGHKVTLGDLFPHLKGTKKDKPLFDYYYYGADTPWRNDEIYTTSPGCSRTDVL